MSKFTCHRARTKMDEWLHHELDPAEDRRMAGHLAGCRDCAHSAAQGRAALSLLAASMAAELPDGASSATLDGIRRRALARLRVEASARPTVSGWRWIAAAAATAAVAAVAALAPVPFQSTPVRNDVLGPAANALNPIAPLLQGDDLEVITTAGMKGTTLRWQGSGDTFLVLKSSRPATFEGAQVAVVCGSEWTDPEPAGGLAFYRVVRSGKHC